MSEETLVFCYQKGKQMWLDAV